MNNIDRLIATLYPNGVEYSPLEKLCISLKKSTLTQDKLNDSLQYPVINSGRDYYGRFSEYNNEGNAIVIASRGEYAGFVSYISEKFWAGGLCYPYRSRNETKAHTKYIFYVLKNSEQRIMDSLVARGSIPALNKADIDKFLIPLPPLPVQEEIVRILDTFSSTVAELEAERAARIRQYEHYRDFLLTFNELSVESVDRQTDRRVRWVTLGEIATKISTGGTPNTQNSSFYDGTIPWLRTQEVNWLDIYDTGIKITDEGFNDSSANWIPMNCVIVAMYGATAAKVAINKISLTTNQACCNIQVDETKALYRYVFYWLCKEYETLRAKGQGSQSNINSLIVKNHPIPLPSLEEQSRIVEILDRFDTLVNDLKTGLPAEIALRRKQYEHYRDTLLTFTQTN